MHTVEERRAHRLKLAVSVMLRHPHRKLGTTASNRGIRVAELRAALAEAAPAHPALTRPEGVSVIHRGTTSVDRQAVHGALERRARDRARVLARAGTGVAQIRAFLKSEMDLPVSAQAVAEWIEGQRA